MDFVRYAIYYCPEPQSELAAFGEQWLGRDAYGRVEISNRFDGLEAEQKATATAAPSRYGFHGTLQAPFRLARHENIRALKDALDCFSKTHQIATAARLKLTTIGDFLALCPSGKVGPNPEIDDLAEQCVGQFDRYRASLSEDDIKRRQPERLTERQREYLKNWGYPFIFDDFRFHLTLTGALPELERTRIEAFLSPYVAELPNEPFTIRSICLFGDPGNGEPFRLIERYPLSQKT